MLKKIHMAVRKSDYLKSDECRQPRLKTLLNMIGWMQSRPLEVKELVELTGLNKRTVYRYLNTIEHSGVSIDKNFNDKYFISTDNCHICKSHAE